MTLNELFKELEKENISKYFSLVAISNKPNIIQVNFILEKTYIFKVNIKDITCTNDFLLECMKHFDLKTIKKGVYVFEAYPVDLDGEVLETLTPFILFDSACAYEFLKDNNLPLSVDMHAPISVESRIEPKEYYILETIKTTKYIPILTNALMFELLLELEYYKNNEAF